MPKMLRSLKINRVDLVDQGAAQDGKGLGPFITLMKRAEKNMGAKTEKEKEKLQAMIDDMSDADRKLMRQMLAGMDLEKMGHDMYGQHMEAETFSDMLHDKQMQMVMSEVGDMAYMLGRSLCSILGDDDVDTKEKPDLLLGSVDQFHASVAGMVDDWVDGKRGIAKVGRKISSDRLSRLKSLLGVLTTIIHEAEGGEVTNEELKKKLEGVTGGDEILRHISDLEAKVAKAAASPAEEKTDVLKSLPEDIRKIVQEEIGKANAKVEELTKQAQAAEELSKRLEHEKELAAETDVCKRWTNLSVDLALMPETLLGLRKANKDQYDALVKQMDAANAATKLTAEIGKSGGDADVSDSAVAEVQKRAEQLVTEKKAPDLSTAYGIVAKQDPGLYEKYRRETRKGVQ